MKTNPATRWLALLACLLLATSVGAEDKPTPAAQALQLNVMGDITIDATGGVLDYAIVTPLTAPVKRIVDQSVRRWRFEPVIRGGRAINAKGKMFLLLTATPVDGGYRMKIDNVRFGGERDVLSRGRIEYPRAALRSQVNAEVVAAIRVDAAGKVVDVVTVGSRLLNVHGSQREQAKMRALFEQATVGSMKNWQFRPADLEAGESAETTMMIPVKYCAGTGCSANGTWQLAGTSEPARPVPWLRPDQQLVDVDRLEDGQPIALDGALRLQTPVAGTVL